MKDIKVLLVKLVRIY